MGDPCGFTFVVFKDIEMVDLVMKEVVSLPFCHFKSVFVFSF
jgi:hypothetical protein